LQKKKQQLETVVFGIFMWSLAIGAQNCPVFGEQLAQKQFCARSGVCRLFSWCRQKTPVRAPSTFINKGPTRAKRFSSGK